MIRYCYRRILLAIPVMVGISLLAFILGLLSPGDPAEFALNQDGLDAPTDAQIAMMREELGLNRPIYVQYFSWFVQVLHGNFGSSYISGKDILHELQTLRDKGYLGSSELSYDSTTNSDGTKTYITADENHKSQA